MNPNRVAGAQPRPVQIKESELKKKVRNVKHLHKAALRNNWVVPDEASPMVSVAYIEAVRNRDIWCPVDLVKHEEDRPKLVKYRNCAEPPPKLELAKMLQAEANTKGINIGMDVDSGRIGDVFWMLACLATLNYNHPVFAKNYRYVRPAPDNHVD